MTWGKHKADEADRIFSLYIRTRAGWNCERCGKHYEPPTSSLHCSHFWGRGKESVRFDPQNASAHCFHCHQYFTANPQEHREWVLNKLGQKEFDALMIRANTYQKRDRAMSLLESRLLLESLDANN